MHSRLSAPDHKNFCGMDPVLGPIIISAIREKTAWRVLYRSEKVRRSPHLERSV